MVLLPFRKGLDLYFNGGAVVGEVVVMLHRAAVRLTHTHTHIHPHTYTHTHTRV